VAAEYGININVRTQTQQLKRLQTQLKEVENTAKSIRSKQLLPEIKGGSPELLRKFKDRLAQIRNEVIVTNNAFVNNTKQINNNAGEIRGFSAALRDARTNTKLFSGEYNVLTQGIQKADFTARFKEIKEFSRIAASTANNLGGAIPMAKGTTFEDLMAFRPTNTREAINDYTSMLRGLEARLDRTSDRFKQVTARIKEMETQLRSPIIQDTANAYSRPAGPRQAMAGENFFNRTLGRNRQFQQGGMFFEPGGFASRRRNALSSGLIGGGFPLLFGQGIGASVGGGIGGIAGGFLGGGLGFGLSIVGTQLGKQVDVLVQATKATGDALGEFTKDFNTLKTSLGETGTSTGQLIDILAKSKGSYEAFLFTQNELSKVVGSDGVAALKEFSDDLRDVNKAFARFFLKLQAGLAKIVNFAGILEGFSGTNTKFLQENLKEIAKETTDTEAARINAQISELQGFLKMQAIGIYQTNEDGSLRDVAGELIKLQKQGKELVKQNVELKTRNFLFQELTKSLSRQLEVTDTVGFKERERIKNAQKLADFVRQYTDAFNKPPTIEEQEAFLRLQEAQSELIIGARLYRDELTRLDKEFLQLNDTAFQLVEVSKAISDGFKDSFKGIIDGTMSVSEAFRNMFNRIADHFLDMAAQMAANALQRGFLGLFDKLFNPANSIPKISDSGPIGDFPTGGSFNLAANGGPVGMRNPYIVGERGPELFVPNQSGNIIPNHDLAGIGGGGTNIVVNVDASGSSVEGDEQQGRELGRVISAAVQSELIQQKRPGGLLA